MAVHMVQFIYTCSANRHKHCQSKVKKFTKSAPELLTEHPKRKWSITQFDYTKVHEPARLKKFPKFLWLANILELVRETEVITFGK